MSHVPSATSKSQASSAQIPKWIEPFVLLGPAGIWLGLLLVIPTLLILN